MGLEVGRASGGAARHSQWGLLPRSLEISPAPDASHTLGCASPRSPLGLTAPCLWPAVPWGCAREVPCPSHSGALKRQGWPAGWLAEKGLARLGFAGCVRALLKRRDM